MTAALYENPPMGGWTADDLERFPEDNVRRELLDGVLIVPPSPSFTHQTIAARLMVLLDDSCPDEFMVTQNVDVRFGDQRSFAPDVLVVTAAAARRTERPVMAHELVLAVEIVSPTSIAMDRITKPAIYAASGIPHFWRIETDDGVTIHTYKLGPVGDVYEPVGKFVDAMDVSEPWPIRFPFSRITPRHRE